MIRLSDGSLIQIGREAAVASLVARRRKIDLQNQLAAAVRQVGHLEGPVARLVVPHRPFDAVKGSR